MWGGNKDKDKKETKNNKKQQQGIAAATAMCLCVCHVEEVVSKKSAVLCVVQFCQFVCTNYLQGLPTAGSAEILVH